MFYGLLQLPILRILLSFFIPLTDADDVTTRHVYCEHSDNEHGQSVSTQTIQTFIQIP